MRMLLLKLLFLLTSNRGGDRDYFMIITIRTFAQFSPFLTHLSLIRFPKEIMEDVRFWPDPLLPLPLTHPLTEIGEWGEINFCKFRVGGGEGG